MRITPRITGNLKRLMSQAVERKLSRDTPKIADEALAGMAQDTPKDTGRASRSWRIESADWSKGVFVLANDTPYIGRLNAGHSSQAPTNFIENRALQYGKATGVIVNYR
jgi:hypothetical protein